MSNVKEMLKFTLAIDNNKKAFIFASLLTNRPTATTHNNMKNLIFIFALVASFTAMAQSSVTFTETSEAREIVWGTTYHLNADGEVFYAVHTCTGTQGEVLFSNILRFKKTHRNIVRLHRRLFAENERGLNLIAE